MLHLDGEGSIESLPPPADPFRACRNDRPTIGAREGVVAAFGEGRLWVLRPVRFRGDRLRTVFAFVGGDQSRSAAYRAGQAGREFAQKI